MNKWVARAAALRLDQQIKELGELMIRRRLFIKADRMFKKPKPGKKRLVKWPKKLVPLYDDKVRARLLPTCLPACLAVLAKGRQRGKLRCPLCEQPSAEGRADVQMCRAGQRCGQGGLAQDEHALSAQAFAEEHFYAWQYERPASPWLFALSALLVVVVMAFCLFPLAPHWCAALCSRCARAPPLRRRHPGEAAGPLPVSQT